MSKIRTKFAFWLFRLATRILPMSTRMVGQAHWVGKRWLDWRVTVSSETNSMSADEMCAAGLRSLSKKLSQESEKL